jgi:hypothetical protein
MMMEELGKIEVVDARILIVLDTRSKEWIPAVYALARGGEDGERRIYAG